MLPSLLVAAALSAPGAPIPRDAVPNLTGPAPRVVAVKADATGAVWITANVYEKRKVPQQFVVNENGKNVLKTQEVEQMVSNYIHKSIGDFGGKFTTAEGTTLTTEEATRRVKNGATLLVTADGKPVDKGWLKAVHGDTVIMTAEGLAEAHFVHGYVPNPMTAAPRITMLGTNEKGEIRLPVNPNAGNFNNTVYYNDFNGGGFPAGRVVGRKMIINSDIDFVDGTSLSPSTTKPGADGKKSLAEIKFDAYDVTGKLISRKSALERLKAGGLVVLAGDNRFPDDDYLKGFRNDLIVIVSNELVFPAGTTNPFDYRAKTTAPAKGPARPAPNAQPLPVPAIGLAQPGIKVQVQVIK